MTVLNIIHYLRHAVICRARQNFVSRNGEHEIMYGHKYVSTYKFHALQLSKYMKEHNQ